jgi:hypothetical protein
MALGPRVTTIARADDDWNPQAIRQAQLKSIPIPHKSLIQRPRWTIWIVTRNQSSAVVHDYYLSNSTRAESFVL